MTIFERYLLRLFAKIFLICFLSFSGLFIIVHLFTNFDELLELGKEQGSHAQFFAEFYGPRILDLFDRTVSTLILASAVFAFALMQRRRELPAIEAAGISKARMTRSLLVFAGLLIVVAIGNREYVMPQYREQLTSSAQNWNQGSSGITHFQKDHLTGLLIRTDQVDVAANELTGLIVQLPIHLSAQIPRITSAVGAYLPETAEHPAGILMDRITQPGDVTAQSDLSNGDRKVVFFPTENPWLKPNECFVATHLTMEELAYGQELNDYSSLGEMIQSLKRPTQWYSRSNRITVHSRITRPLLDLTLLLLALPLVIRFSEENLMAAVGACVSTVVVFQVSILACQVLGSVSLIPTASLTAWLPIIGFLPLTVFSWRMLER